MGLEIFGLTLAILDFTGLSRILERWIDVSRERMKYFLQTFSPGETTERILQSKILICISLPEWLSLFQVERIEPTSKVQRCFWWALRSSLIFPLIILFAGDQSVLVLIAGILLLLYGLALFVFVYLYILIPAFIFSSSLLLHMLYIVFYLLNIPPSGTMGSIGLALAILGFVPNFLNWIKGL